MQLHVAKTGIHVPTQIQTAEDLSPRIGRSAQWIRSRTGVEERRVSERRMDEMAADAAREALGGARPDLILNASLTPVQLIPDSSVFIQRALGYDGIPSFSIHATCLSFLVGLHTASGLLATGAYRRILLVSAEQGTVCRDYGHPESAALIGDGAAAAVLTPTPDGRESALLAWGMTTWPEGAEFAEIPGCGTANHPNAPGAEPEHNLFRMNGPRIYKLAVRKVAHMVQGLLADANLETSDIDWVVPHQASGPALKTLPRMGIDPDRIVDVVGQYGNCIAASMPMALHTAVTDGRIKRGDRVLLLGTGAGLSVAGAVLRW